ncbi:MAG: phospholipase C [Dissulfurispiraceae bacterium]
MRRFVKFILATALTASLLLSTVIPAAFAGSQQVPSLSQNELIKLLQQRIKYVFVIFNENHSFDNEYGTFPGVNGLYSDGTNPRSAANTPGFYQTYIDKVSGLIVQVQPFLIGPNQNSTVDDSVDHSHTGLATKLDIINGVPQMDKFAYDEYYRFANNGGAANNAKGTQFARLVMSHVDCNTIPFFWKWARNFTIFDNIFATEDTPSTPNAVAMIAGQSGETQWVKHGPNGTSYSVNGQTGTTQGPPLVNDPQPFYGSQFDTTTVNKQPAGAKESYANTNIASNLTFASLPLTFEGGNVDNVMGRNLNPGFDLPDIRKDIPFIQSLNLQPVNWRWYQEGYDLESTDINGVDSHNSYVSHHQGPQYFGYLANTPPLRQNFRGMTDFFTDTAKNALPNGGVFYIRGGYTNQMGLKPPLLSSTPSAEVTAINAAKIGDDDHPSYSDRQISEAMAARVINAIAAKPDLWDKSAIIITYDESDGFYDHVPPRILSYGPDGLPLSRGIRVPLILISPYAKTQYVSHAEGDHNAIIETINDIFGLPPLASLPDEAKALQDGNSPEFNAFGPSGFEQRYLGPRDINSPITDSLLSGFDPMRLMHASKPVPASMAMIPDSVVTTLPHYGGHGCQAIGITPITPEGQSQDYSPPAGFNPLPSTYPALN